MQYVILDQWQLWNDEVLKTQLATSIPLEEERAWWTAWMGDQPLPTAPDLTFKAQSDGPFPDSYWFSSVLHLFSDRLIRILRQFNIRFQAFPVRFIDRDSGHDIPLSYYAFRLLATHQCIDSERSIIEEGPLTEIVRLVLTSECQQANEAMFRLERFQFFMIINSELKAALEQANITGFEYTPVDEFQYGMKHWASRNMKKMS